VACSISNRSCPRRRKNCPRAQEDCDPGTLIGHSTVLLILDEPAAGLDTHETEALAYSLRQIVHEGVTVALVDHDMSLVMGSAMSSPYWRKLSSGRRPTSEIVANEHVRRVYLGGES